MSDSRLPTLLYLLMLAFGLLHWAHRYPQLPNVMASHFAADGAPNGWQPKFVFFLLTSLVIAVTAIPTFLVPRKMAMLSPDKINLPNKAYWLAPEQRDETWRFVAAYMAWFGCGLLFVLLYGISQAINANLPAVGHFNSQRMWRVLVGFALFVIVWLIHLLRHFYKVPSSSSSPSPTS
jgi:uncharacterized membrane protein